MIEAITKEAFAELSSNNRETYILDRAQLGSLPFPPD